MGALLKANNAQCLSPQHLSNETIQSVVKHFLQTSFTFALSPQCQLEQMPDGKKANIQHRCGDLRTSLVKVVQALIDCLRTHPSASVLTVTIANACLDSLALMSVNWRYADGATVGKALLARLCSDCVSIGATASMQGGFTKLFTRGMPALLRASTWTSYVQVQSWMQALLAGLPQSNNLQQLAVLSFDAATGPSSNADAIEETSTRACRLIRALDAVGERYECVRLLFQLAETYSTKLKNPVAAAFVYRTVAAMLPWDELPVAEFFDGEPRLTFSSYTGCSRKERVLKLAVDGLHAGYLFQEAYEVSKDLAAHYESTWNYVELERLLVKQASFLRSATDPNAKFIPTFWFLHFLGPGFPEWLRDQSFIRISYQRLESWADLADRLRASYSGVKVVNSISGNPSMDYAGFPNVIEAIAVLPAELTAPHVPSGALSRPSSPLLPVDIPVPQFVRDFKSYRNVGTFKCVVRHGDVEQDFSFVAESAFGPSIETKLTVAKQTQSSPRQLPPLRAALPTTVSGNLRTASPPPRARTPPPDSFLQPKPSGSAPSSRSNSPARPRPEPTPPK